MITWSKSTRNSVLGLALLLLLSGSGARARNEILGEIKFVGPTRVEKTSGVWVDNLYVGYLGELKGSKKVLLMPGEHGIAVRQAGYKDFSKTIVVEPGQRQVVQVSMQRDLQVRYPDETAQVKLSVRPDRSAVFVDDTFAGHVDEFNGPGQAMLLSAGKHRIKITLPGYQPFDTEINLLPNQKFHLRTDLFPGSIAQADPLLLRQ